MDDQTRRIIETRARWNASVKLVQDLERAQWRGENVTDREIAAARREARLWRAQVEYLERPPGIVPIV